MIQLKTDHDLACIQEAGNILFETIQALKRNLAEGVTTLELDHLTRAEIEKRGGRPAFLGYQGYPASLCISINEEVIHGIPGKRRLKRGDLIGLDLGVVYRDRIADAAVTLPLGEINDADRKLLAAAEECLRRGIAQARAGNRVRDISDAIFACARAASFEVVREYCGHGVGFSLHEDPQIYNYPSPGPNPKLKPGMVLAIEPMVNRGSWKVKLLEDGWTVVTADGRPSAHFEHTIAVTEDEPVILTRW